MIFDGVADRSDRITVMAGIRASRCHSTAHELFPRLTDLTNAVVDRTFLLEVFLISAAQKFLRAVHHEQLLPKFSSNIRLTKGVLCPEKSIRSIKSSMVR